MLKHNDYDDEPEILDEKTGSKQHIDVIFVRLTDDEIVDILNYGKRLLDNEQNS
jgi:hypothetical protein